MPMVRCHLFKFSKKYISNSQSANYNQISCKHHQVGGKAAYGLIGLEV